MTAQPHVHDLDLTLDAHRWDIVAADLDAQGWAVLTHLLSASECEAVGGLFERDEGFRKRVDMARHGYGQGLYKYFAYPLPRRLQDLRTALYPRLAPIANAWHERLGLPVRFPADHAAFLERCHQGGQGRPTPLVLQYGPGDYNRLHQDLYGHHVFPLQAAILLSRPGIDFEGGEFVLTEQRARMQSRAHVVPLTQGDAVIFAVNSRPVRGSRGDARAALRHGVSTVRSGRRRTLGLIFHDAA